MKNKFNGWNTVFGFTLRQSSKGIGFRITTTIVALLLIGAFVLINILIAKPDDDKDKDIKPSPIETVIVLDQSGLEPTDYKTMSPELMSEQYSHIKFIASQLLSNNELVRKSATYSNKSIAIHITVVEDGFHMEALIPEDSEISKSDVKEILPFISNAFESNKLLQVGLTMEQLNSALKPAVNTYTDVGEDKNPIVFAIKMIAPMLFGFIFYFMLLLYGQNVCKSVSTEKTSKLVETLLTSVHPYALIMGKVLAVTSLALMQFVLWIVAGIIGLYGGNYISQMMYPEYENSVVTIINFLKDNIGETAMTLPALLLAIVIFIVGFLFYSVLAGVSGSIVSKPEDLSSTQAIFQFPIMISFLVSYLSPVLEKEALTKAIRYIPFTAPFSVPAELITGTVGFGEGLLSLGILSVFSFIIINLSGRIYKGMILYTDQKLSFKLISNILKAKN
jgi:ABC-type Na+ efflux pump permease subunit